MSTQLTRTALFQFLQASEYGSKLSELRSEVTAWLELIPTTFPHYTRHTVDHSDEIIAQVSRLLFSDVGRPEIGLSSVEGYVIGASAYLHDAGMVVSEVEKLNILRSAEWHEWVSEGQGGHQRWLAIDALRQSDTPTPQRHFLADLETRFLIAEFVRRQHHFRAAQLLVEYEPFIGRFAFGDPILTRTIADVCTAHGLSHDALLDSERYPDRSDIRGETVNVRFCAILLRLGDLLDLRTDRACPLLLAQGCPLPADSLAHWTQYQRIQHRFTGPDLIELRAECETQGEHRLLQDWCRWLVNELGHASALMARSARHSDWHPPRASMAGPDPTIRIRPAKSATYRPVNWEIKLDHDTVVNRLVHDVYGGRLGFLRELIQNSLDASRVRLYADLEAAGIQPPTIPSRAPSEWRARYPVRVTLSTKTVTNALSGETESTSELSVEDLGMGMDEGIITSYLLQVGRSYYTSPAFLRSARFVPTSRFGVGFLSVFSVGDEVVVDTLRAPTTSAPDPLRLTLTGPRNYLLVERGTRRLPGTIVTVRLRERFSDEEVVEALRTSCKRVEFPIVVTTQETALTISSERPADYTFVEPARSIEGYCFELKAYDVERPGIDGELYVLEFRSEDREKRDEDWTHLQWYRYNYPQQYPQVVDRVPRSLTCFHGIALDRADFGDSKIARLDFRRDVDRVPLGRTVLAGSGSADKSVQSRWVEILEQHLASTSRADGAGRWAYIQRMVGSFGGLDDYWIKVPRAIRFFNDGAVIQVSAEEARDWDVISVLMEQHESYKPSLDKLRSTGSNVPDALSQLKHGLTTYDVLCMSEVCHQELFKRREPVRVELVGEYLRVDWVKGRGPAWPAVNPMESDFYFLNAGIAVGVACVLSRPAGLRKAALVNTGTPVGQWIRSIQSALTLEEAPVGLSAALRLKELVDSAARFGHQVIKLGEFARRMADTLPAELQPPEPFPADAAAFGVFYPSRLDSLRKRSAILAMPSHGETTKNRGSRGGPSNSRKPRGRS